MGREQWICQGGGGIVLGPPVAEPALPHFAKLTSVCTPFEGVVAMRTLWQEWWSNTSKPSL